MYNSNNKFIRNIFGTELCTTYIWLIILKKIYMYSTCEVMFKFVIITYQNGEKELKEINRYREWYKRTYVLYKDNIK